jgi:hypothetical protein
MLALNAWYSPFSDFQVRSEIACFSCVSELLVLIACRTCAGALLRVLYGLNYRG